MGFLERAIKDSIRKGVNDAIGNAVRGAVEPKATEFVNKVARTIDESGKQTRGSLFENSGLESALSNLQRSVEGYATEAAKLPEESMAQGAVCSKCGKQNSLGTKFCSECGTKLPFALQEEQATQEQCAAVMAEWDEKLPQYPKWSCGGSGFNIEEYEPGNFIFAAGFDGDSAAARQAVEEYRELAMESGFRPAGQYPSKEHLYKKLGDTCYHIDTEHCFDGDSDCPCIGLYTGEPYGGFDYVAPSPVKKSGLGSLKDLGEFKDLKDLGDIKDIKKNLKDIKGFFGR